MTTLFNKGFKGWGQLGIFLAMWGGGMIIGSMISVGVWVAMTGQGMLTMAQDMMNPEYATAIKTIQAVSTLFAFFAPAAAYAFICYRNGWAALGFKKELHWKPLLVCLLIMLFSGPLIDSLSTLNKAIPLPAGAKTFFDDLEKKYEDQVKVIGNVSSVGQYLLSLFMIALLPAIFEEVLFRGGMQNLFMRWWKSPWIVIVFTSILFSAIHASWYGFLPRIALGMLLGLMLHFTQNIWYPIIAHFVNNAAVATYMYYLSLSGKPISLQDQESTFPWWLGLAMLGVLGMLFRYLRKVSQQYPPQEIFYERTNPFDQRDTLA